MPEMWTQSIPGGRLVISADLPVVPSITTGLAWRYDSTRDALVEVPEDSRPALTEAPRNLYLAAARVDTSDTQAVLDFVEKYGPLRIDRTIQVDRGQFGLRSDLWIRPSRILGLASLYVDEPARLAAARERAERGVAVPAEAIFGFEPMEHARHGLDSLRELVRYWRAIHEGRNTKGVTDDAPEVLAVVLDSALQSVAPRMAWQPATDDEQMQLRLSPPVFCVGALQLARHIAAATPWKCCPECGEEFDAHEGRAQGSRRRGDAKYCTSYCSQKVARRNYRNRLKRPDTADAPAG